MTHQFTPDTTDGTRCGHRLSYAPGYLGGTCGFRATNRVVHAPGAVAEPERHLAVAHQDQDTAAAASA